MFRTERTRAKKASRRLRGSYTIEAALLLPVILFVVILLMYAAFFLYDDCCIRQGAYLAALRGESAEKDADLQRQEAQHTLGRYLKEELWAVQGTAYAAEADAASVRTSVKSSLRAPLGNRLFHTVWELEAQGEAQRVRPVHFIRICNRAEDALHQPQEGGTE